MPHDLDPIIHPRTIAVIGASKDPFKRGHRLIQSLLADDYSGEIFPVNPKESTILGLKCYRSIDELPDSVDLAIVCTAASTVPGVIESCGRKRVKGAMLLAGGFSEAGEAGRQLEQKVVGIARAHGLRLIGPNTAGMFSARRRCNAASRSNLPRGPLALLSNSANVLSSLQNELRFHGHSGINIMLSVGNQSDILFHEYLECFADDPDTRAVVSYVEGFKNGRAYLDAARKVSRSKPIVMYAVGRTSEGKGAAKSHSGSLAGDYAVTRGVMRQCGVVLVDQSDHLFPAADALTLFPPMRGRRVAVLSEGGGPISIAAETLAQRGLILATLTPETQAKIHEIVPNATAISNPVDAGGGTDPRVEYYGSISKLILQDPNIDALLLVGLFGGYVTAPKRYGASIAEVEQAISVELAEDMRRHGKPVIVQSHFAHLKTASLDALRKAGVPYERHVEVAVNCLAYAADYHAMRERLAQPPAAAASSVAPEAARILEHARAERRDLLEPEARDLLQAYGIAVPPHVVARSESELPAAAARFGSAPLAVKVVSPQILHKSESGGVRLNVAGEGALRSAFQEIVSAAQAKHAGARIEGVLVTPMAKSGVEIIVGVTTDPQYGPVIMLGLGGIFVEVIRDVAFRALPITRADAEEMMADLRHRQMLEGVRGIDPVDKGALADLLLSVSRVATLHSEIAEIDLNPVIARADGYSIVDARIILNSGKT